MFTVIFIIAVMATLWGTLNFIRTCALDLRRSILLANGKTELANSLPRWTVVGEFIVLLVAVPYIAWFVVVYQAG